MKRETYISDEIDSAGKKAQYDEHVKRMLKDKNVLSYILKYSVREFKNYSLEDAMAAIEGEPEISSRHVRPNAAGTLENESNIPGEGKIFFDIVFYVMTKNAEKEKMYINVEAQKSFYPGYDLVTRGIIYSARLISQQMDVEYTAEEYSGVKKVYSIWVCLNAPVNNRSYERVADSIVEYSMHPTVLYQGNPDDKIAIGRHDLMSAVFINLNPDKTMDSDNVLIGMLSTLLSNGISPDDKKKKLESIYKMPMSKELEKEAAVMCNLSEAIEEMGIQKGLQRAVYELIHTGDLAPQAGAKKLGISVEQLKTDMEKAGFVFPDR